MQQQSRYVSRAGPNLFLVVGMNSVNASVLLALVQPDQRGPHSTFFIRFCINETSLRHHTLPPKRTQEVDDADLLIAAIGMSESDLRLIIGDVQGESCGLKGLGQGAQGPHGSGDGDGHQQNRRDGGGKLRERMKKLYKITEDELAINSLEDCVVMRMAVKDH